MIKYYCMIGGRSSEERVGVWVCGGGQTTLPMHQLARLHYAYASPPSICIDLLVLVGLPANAQHTR